MPGIAPRRRRDSGESVAPNRGSFLRLVTEDDPPAIGVSPPDLDVVALILADTRSTDTQTAYRADYRLFFGEGYSPADVIAWASQSVPALAADLQRFKGEQIQKGMSEATVNRRLASLRSLLSRCHSLGIAATDGRSLVRSEKVTPYRDTRGISLKLMRKLLDLPDPETLKGKRDLLILRLALENGLRCSEITGLAITDLSYGDRRIRIRGKGRGTRTEWLEISTKAVAAARVYLLATGRWKASGKPLGPIGAGPLLLSCDHRPEFAGKRLTADGLYAMIVAYGEQIGVRLSVHKLRHSAITAVLQLNGGDIAAAMDFSRHASPEDVADLQ